ncbi:hypothetical protein ZWY2020_008012 [Hordeum vulgare]|nr:hypothetical protein ZWY2020_008012 [Hordeum vulgare]
MIGMQLLARIYKGHVILEMGNQMIVKEPNVQTPTRSHCYGLIMDIKQAMDGFSECQVTCVNWRSNSLAHRLAALHRRSGNQALMADVPTSLRSLMIAECTSPLQ